MRERRRLVWVYDRKHLEHPFLVLGLESFAAAGWDVLVLSSDHIKDRAYASEDAFSFEARDAHWSNQVLRKMVSRRVSALRQRVKSTSGINHWTLRLQLWGHSWLYDSLKWFAKLRRDTIDSWIPYLRAFRRLLAVDADVFIVSRPDAAMWAGLAAKVRARKLIYYPFELYGDQHAKPNWLIQSMEKLVLRYAIDGLATQNEMRAHVYTRERGARVAPVIVHNYKPGILHKAVTPQLRSAHPNLAARKIVLYEGQLTDGRWLEHLANAVLFLPDDVALVMLGPQKGKWLTKMADKLSAPLATGRLIVLPPVSHDELPNFVADADLGVIIYDDSVRNNLFCEPGKLGDYIAVGVPVLAPDFPTIGPVVRTHDIGVCFKSSAPEHIAESIRQGLARPKSAWRPSLDRAAESLNWETQFPGLLAMVEACLPALKPSPIAERACGRMN